MDILVIKINENIEDNDSLRKRVEKSWKINPSRLKSVKYVIVLFNQKVIGEFKLLPNINYNLETGRVDLELTDIDTELLNLKGKNINYNTSNPCTIATLNKLNQLIY